jgi:hypothetical protein
MPFRVRFTPHVSCLFTAWCLPLALLLLFSLPSDAIAADDDAPATEVLRVYADRVDVALPSHGTLIEGEHLIVQRSGELLAELEVTHVGRFAASCRIVRAYQDILVGDRVRFAAEGSSAPGSAVDAESSRTVRVRQVMGSSVYLDHGRNAGLQVGQRVRIVREGLTIAELTVEYIANRSASCRVLSSTGDVAAGDLAVAVPMPLASPGVSPAPGAPQKETAVESSRATTAPVSTQRELPARPWANRSGTLSIYWLSYQDGTAVQRDFSQLTTRASLYLRGIGGSPYEFRFRGRGRQETTTQPDRPTETDSSNRLYEMAIVYEPEDSHYTYQLGRLAPSAYIGFQYLDGFIAEAHFNPHYGVGAFYGNRPDPATLDFSNALNSYGGFVHFRSRTPGRPLYSDMVLAAIGEYDNGNVSREYLSWYGRQGSGGDWSLYERAELDLNRDWRKITSGSSYQLSNLLFSGTYRFTKSVRVGATYDQRRRYLTFEDRNTPEELFNDMFREGFRLSAYLGPPRGVRLNLSVGMRRREGDVKDSLTYNGSVFHTNVGGWNLYLGADYSAFTGEASEGDLADIQIRKYFHYGHDIGITVGTSTTRILSLNERRKNDWLRLSGTIQLPRRFFILTEYEISRGDDFEGKRLFLQLGYRL